MLDAHLLRTQAPEVARQLLRRGFVLDLDLWERLEQRRKGLQVRVEELRAERNRYASDIGRLKKAGEQDKAQVAQVRATALGQQLQRLETELEQLLVLGSPEAPSQQDFLLRLPNVPAAQVPDGLDEQANVEVARWGAPHGSANGAALDHVALGEPLGLRADLGAKLSGARFTVLRGHAARLHRALVQFMLDVHTTEHGYEEVYVPYLVKREALQGTGQLPKFEQDLFKTHPHAPDAQSLYLIPTAEVPVTNLVAQSILTEEELPLRWVCHTPCFRSEAGSAGRDTRGLIRQHQFDKVELVQVVRPEDSQQALDELRGHAETILRKLELPYRTMHLCAGDMGFSAASTFDLEVWLPGQGVYREISSCSNMGDFQARRMQARFRRKGQNKPELVHTLNGSALAVGRTLVAVLENYQQEGGRVAVPAVLQPYLGGQQALG